MSENKKKRNVKTKIMLLVFCLSMLFTTTVLGKEAPVLTPNRFSGMISCEPFTYNWKSKEYNLTVEKGVQIDLLSNVRYQKKQSLKQNKSLDQLKGEKSFSVEDTTIASVSPTGILTVQAVGKTYVNVTYQGLEFRFLVVVKEATGSQNQDIVKLRLAIAKFNKDIYSKNSFTRKNRRKKLSQLSAVRTIEMQLDKNNEGNTYKNGVYKGVCVVPDYSVFEKRYLWFDEYCSSLDPTNPKGKCPFKATKASYENGKITIWLKKPITEDQLFGFKTHSLLEEENPLGWEDNRIEYSYFNGKKSKFNKAVTYISFIGDRDIDENGNINTSTVYCAKGMIKAGAKKIVMTPYIVSQGNPKKTKEVQLQPDRYRFWQKSSTHDNQVMTDLKWLKKLYFDV